MPFFSTTADDAGARLAGLLDSAMDGILSVNEQQTILLYNRAAEAIFGWSAEEVRDQRLEMLLPVRYRSGHGGMVRRFGATGVTSRRMGGGTVILGQRKDGTEFPMDASISQLDTPDGKIYTVIVRDVTERERARQELAAFAAEASGVREQEKTRIARELHDELAQSLTALKMDTNWLRDHVPGNAAAQDKLDQMLALLDAAVAATRRIAADLRPLLLDDLGLAPAIEWLTQNFTQRTGVPCVLDIDDTLELQEPYATAVFRIVQESLVNVGKHARATQVRVRVTREADGAMALSVEDNGVGFRPGAPRRPQSLGLLGLRERAHLLKGDVRIDSTPGGGTRVRARIPVAPEDAA